MRKNALRQYQLGIVCEALTEIFPATIALQIEHMQVKSDQLGLVVLQQFGDSSVETFVIERFRQITMDRSFAIVQNAQSIAESAKHRLMARHEPSLQQVLAEGVGGAQLQGLQNPLVLVCHGFLGNKLRSELTGVGKSRQGVLVDIFVIGPEPVQHLCDKSGVDGFVEFVRLHKMIARDVFLRKISGLCKRQDDMFD